MNWLLTAVALLAYSVSAAAAPAGLAIAIAGGKTDQTNVVVRYPVPKDADLAGVNVVKLSSGTTVPAQLAGPALTDDPAVKHYLVFVVPKLKAGETITATTGTVNYFVAPPQFAFVEKKGEPTDLVYGGASGKRKVIQYFNLPHDPKDHYYTFKPFHNVYDPAKGELLLSNTSAKSSKDGLYPHHRGLFFGFNKIGYGDKVTADIWHGTNGVFSDHDKTLVTEAGEVLGRQRSAISWHGKDGGVFANEEREVAVYAVNGGTMIDWSTLLTTKLERVRLDGDPQHAGFHFRAHQEVAKNGKENTYFLRPDGKGRMGETRNWDAKTKNPAAVNLPWNAMSFVIAGKRYTVLRINHPDNPTETRGSEREYGRFGDYFEYDLTPARPLKLRYRVWVQEGEMTLEQCQSLAETFTVPLAAKPAAAK